MTSFSTVKLGLNKKAKVKAVLGIESKYWQGVSVSLRFRKSTGGGPSNETICARWYKLCRLFSRPPVVLNIFLYPNMSRIYE